MSSTSRQRANAILAEWCYAEYLREKRDEAFIRHGIEQLVELVREGIKPRFPQVKGINPQGFRRSYPQDDGENVEV